MGNKVINMENWKSKIREKLAQQNKESPRLYNDIKAIHKMELEEFIIALGDKKTFKEKFLVPHYKMYNLLQNINTKIKELREKTLTKEEIQESINELNNIKLEMSESKLEIYFCNAVGGDPKFLKMLANITMAFGLVHTGLLIDDLVIQWGRGLLGKSLISPSISAKYNDYIYAIELDNKEIWDLIKETYDNIEEYITNKRKYEEMGTLKAFKIANEQLDIFAEQCVYYNINKTYSLYFENCQNFVNSILSRIKLKIDKSGEVGKVLKMVEDKGDNIDFIYKKNTFNTRKDLDEFVFNCNFGLLPKDHRRVLFCYRNVFEYYQRNKPNEEKYKSSDKAKSFWRNLSLKEKFN